MNLSELETSKKVYVKAVNGSKEIKQRLFEHGISRGTELVRVKSAPLKDPIEFKTGENHLFIRQQDLAYIEVSTTEIKETRQIETDVIETTRTLNRDPKKIKVALVGNPNCGKSTLFNNITKSRSKIANYNGATVEINRSEIIFQGVKITFLDLPGLYSLTPYSPEERASLDLLLEESPDILLNITNLNNLQKDLQLTTELQELEIPNIIVLNMFDEFEKNKGKIDYNILSSSLKSSVLSTTAKDAKTKEVVLKEIIKLQQEEEHHFTRPQYPQHIESQISEIKSKKHCSYYSALKKVEQTNQEDRILDEIKEQRKAYVNALLKKSKYILQDNTYNTTTSEKIDKVVTDRFLGIPFLIGILLLVFFATFSLGEYPTTLLEHFIEMLSGWVNTFMEDGVLKQFIQGALIQGIGAVVVFLPSILILFFFTTLLEDSGYMARAIFVIDRIMRKWGLQGNAFIPLLMGFGCNVPAIMATRTIRQRNERLRTMLVIPFMSCSARIPIFILFANALFPSHKSLIITILYLIGIIFGIVASKIMQKTALPSSTTPFIYELPPYRFPHWRNLTYQMWDKTYKFLQKIGSTILLGVIIIWTLSNITPRSEEGDWYDFQISQIKEAHHINLLEKSNYSHSEWKYMEKKYQLQLEAQKLVKSQYQLENSLLGTMGHFMVALMKPLGFDWKMSVSLLAGISAKEVIVSTMGFLYRIDTTQINNPLSKVISSSIKKNQQSNGRTILSGISFLLFVLLYFPCIGVLSTIKAETQSWRWAWFAIGYTTGLAYIVSLLVYQIGSLFV
ncbi:ferrous iron transport protein B [Halosquirtibacter laminarini]|uniref:Ferrous iron transport protein B n=1 Tax=Halosquirtibacter laminarini TaxID=3374600 RepID=A0AC61NGQ3_9BACT|nr:ferrous iron transport protein B [Prolixibacteraceae bacterium]